MNSVDFSYPLRNKHNKTKKQLSDFLVLFHKKITR